MKKTIFERVVFCNQWIWEIRAKEQNLFAKQERRIATNDFFLLRMPTTDNIAQMDQVNLDYIRLRNNHRATVKYKHSRSIR